MLQTFFNLEIIKAAWPILLAGLGNTVMLSLVVVPLGLLGGLGLAMLASVRKPWVRWPLMAWVDFFRAFPPMNPSGTTTSESSTVLPRPARMMGQAAVMISRLKKVCSMAQCFQAIVVSSQRPKSTIGKNRIRYAAAPSMSGDGL